MLADATLPAEQVYWNEMTRIDEASRSALYSQTFRKALRGYDPFSIVQGMVEPSMGWDPTSRLQYWDFKTCLAEGILTKVDRASMAHGLEVRVPLLDHVLVEFAASIPSRPKIGSGRGKRLFKESLRGVVPRDTIQRRKRGFTPPLSSWLSRAQLGPIFENQVLGGDSFISNFVDISAARSIWDDQWNGRRARPYLLWSLLILEIWGRQFL
jgi:asparagine synthase (glutamine-hydrolysing)